MTEYVFDKSEKIFANKFKEEIIRCRDCANYATDELGDYCTLLDFEDVKGMANGFCAWGERREQ